MSNNPFDAPNVPPADMPPVGGSAAAERVKPPAIGLIVVAVLSALASLFGVGTSAMSMAGINPAAAQNEEQFEEMRQQMGENAQFVDTMERIQKLTSGPVGLVLNIIGLAASALIGFGAMKMMKLESYAMAITASVVAMLPINNCCCIGLPVGVWALVILLSADVKSAFR